MLCRRALGVRRRADHRRRLLFSAGHQDARDLSRDRRDGEHRFLADAHVAVGRIRPGACDRVGRHGERGDFSSGAQPQAGRSGVGIGRPFGLARPGRLRPAGPVLPLGGRCAGLDP